MNGNKYEHSRVSKTYVTKKLGGHQQIHESHVIKVRRKKKIGNGDCVFI